MSKQHQCLTVFVLAFIVCAFCVLPGLGRPKPAAQKQAPASKTEEFDCASALSAFRLRNIGPANMGGRTVDFAVPATNASVIYAAVGPSGLWKSTNAGITWEPSFDKEGSVSVGAVAVSASHPDIVWVGSGEATARNSVGIGDGVYKSEDAGKTWKNTGLADTRMISNIIIDPANPDIVYVGALGHLWGPNEDRGVFKTADGGKTWKKILYVNKNTGVADMSIDPSNSRILYAAMWDFQRAPYSFRSGGDGSGIYKTTDGGETWKNLTRESRGLPAGINGRIGVDVAPSNPSVVYALVENKEGGLFRSDDKGETWIRMCDKRTYDRINFRPFYYSRMTVDPTNDLVIYVYSGSCYVSKDAGRTYDTIGRGTHSDHHALWVDPNNPHHIIDGNDGGIDISWDGGKTYFTVQSKAWAEVYNVTTDMRDPYYVNIGLQDNGNWEGPSNSRDRSGILNHYWFNTGGGDGFYAQIDPVDWSIVYRNLQMGRIERHNIKSGDSQDIKPQAKLSEEPYRFNWNSPIYISPHDHNVVYFGGNFLFRSRDRGRSWEKAGPDLSTNDPKKEQDSGGPITVDNTGAEIHCTILSISESPLEQGLIWVGTDDGLVQVTRDDGKTWDNVTKNIKGLPSEDNWVTRVEASHFSEGAAYISISRHQVDDYKPYIFKTEDYGKTWISLASNLPPVGYIHVIREDLENKNLLFAGSEFGLFFSFDGGKKWIPFKWDFPTVAVRDIQIHPRERDLVVGTHGRGVWIMDDIRPLEKLTPESARTDAELYDIRPTWLYSMKSTSDVDTNDFPGQNPPFGTAINYYVNAGIAKDARLKLTIFDREGREVRSLRPTNSPGINRMVWDLRQNAPTTLEGEAPMGGFGGGSRGSAGASIGTPLAAALRGGGPGTGGGEFARGGGAGGGTLAFPGEYRAVLEVNGRMFEKAFTVKEDQAQGIPMEERTLNQKYAAEAAQVSAAAGRLSSQIESASTQLAQLETSIKSMKNVDAAVLEKVRAVKDKVEALRKVFSRGLEGQTGYRQPYKIALRGGTTLELISSVTRNFTGYPGAPTQTSIDKLEEYRQIMAPLEEKMKEVTEKDIPELNKLLAAKGVPFIRL